MKLRSLIVFGAGIATGLAIAKKLAADDDDIVHGPQRAQASNPALRVLSSGTQKLSDRATVVSLGAIRKAREAIRDRLGENGYEDAAWS
jgi:NAD(P)-dependent dehydrogenase (short-subunit alcohol dehydrogenase family)